MPRVAVRSSVEQCSQALIKEELITARPLLPKRGRLPTYFELLSPTCLKALKKLDSTVKNSLLLRATAEMGPVWNLGSVQYLWAMWHTIINFVELFLYHTMMHSFFIRG